MSSVRRLALSAVAFTSLTSAAVIDLPIFVRNTYACVQVNVGTPAETYFLRFDTGSATTWMVDAECARGTKDTCLNYSGFPRNGYDLNASSTGVSLGTWGDIDYLGGGTGGSGVADTFTFEETKWNQTFMAANESSWTATAADGIFGLAFSYVADAGTQTIVETMIQQGILDAPRFGIYQGTENNDTGNAAGDGVLTIGGSKEDKYVDGDLTWVPLERLNGEYQVWRSPLQTVTGSKKDQNGNISSTPTEFARAWGVFDTGGALMTVPPNEVNALYESIGWNYTAILKGDHFPLCTEFNSSWSFTFAFGEQKDETKTLTLTGDQWARPGFAYNSSLCWPPFEDGNTDGFFLFGSDFMSQFYTIFDFGAEEVVNYKPQVGFGALKKEYRMRA